jgi:hypothetical protein
MWTESGPIIIKKNRPSCIGGFGICSLDPIFLGEYLDAVSLKLSQNLGTGLRAPLIHPTYSIYNNVQGEPVFSVMAAGWFCEKSG